MPRTKLSQRIDNQQQIVKLIRMYLFTDNTSVTDCAERMSLCGKTLYNRMKKPGEFTLSEIGLLCRTLGIPQNEMIEAIKQFMSSHAQNRA